MSEDVVIRVDGLWKRYGLPLAWARDSRFRSGGGPAGAAPKGRGPWALADVSLEVTRGQTVGVIGRNGAGKSTLLKVLCGVTPPTRGSVAITGRVFPMLELNAGVHPELTGRENARLLAAVIGLSRRETEACLPAIEEFCELGEFFDRPVRTYSSGMLARLGFAVAMHVEAEVLLIDEVLAVGDFAFQKKCVSRVADLTRRDTTAILVSHNPYLVERMCDRVLLLSEGRVEELGDPADVIARYFELGLPSLEGEAGSQPLPADRPGTGEVRLVRLEILGPDGTPTSELSTDEPVTFRLHYRTQGPVHEPNFGIRIYDAQNTIVLSLASTEARRGWEVSGEGFVDCRLEQLPLMPNLYLVQTKIAGLSVMDVCEVAARFAVKAGREVLMSSGNMGIAYEPGCWSHRS